MSDNINSIHYNSGINPRWINYIDNTRHVEITLKKEQMDLLEKYLRSWLEFGRYAAKMPEPEEKHLTSMSNNILDLIICSKMHKIGDYELVHLPANLHSRAQQQLEKQEQDGLVFRPYIDEL